MRPTLGVSGFVELANFILRSGRASCSKRTKQPLSFRQHDCQSPFAGETHSPHKLSRPLEFYSVKTSCSVLKAEVSVFADTAPNFFANLTWSTARI